MIWDTLERVNRLRKEAMEDPEFLDSAKHHEDWINSQAQNDRGAAKKKKAKKLADIYQDSEFSINPTGTKH